jgi:hypothetical protein
MPFDDYETLEDWNSGEPVISVTEKAFLKIAGRKENVDYLFKVEEKGTDDKLLSIDLYVIDTITRKTFHCQKMLVSEEEYERHDKESTAMVEGIFGRSKLNEEEEKEIQEQVLSCLTFPFFRMNVSNARSIKEYDTPKIVSHIVETTKVESLKEISTVLIKNEVDVCLNSLENGGKFPELNNERASNTHKVCDEIAKELAKKILEAKNKDMKLVVLDEFLDGKELYLTKRDKSSIISMADAKYILRDFKPKL